MLLYLFLLATVFAPPVLAVALRRTRAWWVGALVAALVGIYLLLTIDHADHHGEEGFRAWYEIGNFFQRAYGVLMLAYGAIVLAASNASRRARRRPPSIPPARVI